MERWAFFSLIYSPTEPPLRATKSPACFGASPQLPPSRQARASLLVRVLTLTSKDGRQAWPRQLQQARGAAAASRQLPPRPPLPDQATDPTSAAAAGCRSSPSCWSRRRSLNNRSGAAPPAVNTTRGVRRWARVGSSPVRGPRIFRLQGLRGAGECAEDEAAPDTVLLVFYFQC